MPNIHENKIYPNLEEFSDTNLEKVSEPSAPKIEEAHVYRLKQIEEVEKFLRDEIRIREKLTKKFKSFCTFSNYVERGLIFTGVASASIGIAAFSTGIGAPVGIGLESIALAAGLLEMGVSNLKNRMVAKTQKNKSILFCARNSLDMISAKVSKAINDCYVDNEEFQSIMIEKQRYIMEKEKIRMEMQKQLDAINSKEKEKIIDQAKKEEREKIVKNLTSAQTVKGT